MKKMLIILLSLFSIGVGTCFAITITNKTDKVLHGTDYLYNLNAKARPAKDVVKFTIPANGTAKWTPKVGPGRRMSVSDSALTLPSDGNPGVLGNSVRFSDVEYTMTKDGTFDTIDLTYVDGFSYPLQITVGGSTWGFDNMADAVKALQSVSGQAYWADLIEYDDSNQFRRITGPNVALGGGNPAFASACPIDLTTWATDPAGSKVTGSGYVTSLQGLAKKQNFQGKSIYGFFLYPADNMNGQFNNVEVSKVTEIIVNGQSGVPPKKTTVDAQPAAKGDSPAKPI